MTRARAIWASRPQIAQSAPDDRDSPYTPPSSGFWFKRGCTLMPYVTTIEDQGDQGSCTAHAVTTACEAVLARAGAPMELSRAFNYYLARDYESRVGSEGAVLRDALQAAHHYGIPPESTWPYDPALENQRPSDIAFAMAAQAMLGRYELINVGFNAGSWQEQGIRIKQAISQGNPVVVAFPIGEQIFSLTGPLETQNLLPIGAMNPYAGIHAVAVVGYLGGEYGPLVFANSWTQEWGDNGFGVLPLGLLPTTFEARAVRTFAGYDTDGRSWVLNNQDAAIDFVDANVKTPPGCQAIIDACTTFNILRSELEEINGWPSGSVTLFANTAEGKSLNWKGFQL